MYGGNANLYHLPLSEYAPLLDFMAEAASPDAWVLPSVGPDYGHAIDQARILKTREFPTAMLLPMTFPYTDDGLADGARRFTDAFGTRPADGGPTIGKICPNMGLDNQSTVRCVGRLQLATLFDAVHRYTPGAFDRCTAIRHNQRQS